jgi:putative membrane protein (TIGR04086 family)
MENFKKRKRGLNDDLNFSRLFKRILLYTLLFFVASIIVMIILSLIFYNTSDPTSKIGIISLSAFYTSSFICGIALSKQNKQFYILGGILLGAMIFLNTLLISLFLGKDGLSLTSIGWRLISPVLCVLGSLAGIHRDKPHRKRRHR